jgi:hypothetical protein
MRRTYLAAIVIVALVVIVLIALQSSEARHQETPTPSAQPTFAVASPPVADVSPSSTLDMTALPATAEAYAVAHAEAMGELTIGTSEYGMVPSVSFTEAQINALIEPYAPELGNVSNVELDLMPGSAAISADVGVLGIATVKVVTAGEISLEDNTFVLNITEAMMGGIRPPESAIDSVREEVVPLVYSAILDGLVEYAAPGEITLTDVEVTDTHMIISFIFATPVPTATPTPE